jgi:hypothetical protein
MVPCLGMMTGFSGSWSQDRENPIGLKSTGAAFAIYIFVFLGHIYFCRWSDDVCGNFQLLKSSHVCLNKNKKISFFSH